jgi:hypothetical protein
MKLYNMSREMQCKTRHGKERRGKEKRMETTTTTVT